MEWKNGERGPTCFCGMPTTVVVSEDGQSSLICFAHTVEAGALFPLPKNRRPTHWPNLSDEEMMTLVDQGFDEQAITEGAETHIDSSKLAN